MIENNPELKDIHEFLFIPIDEQASLNSAATLKDRPVTDFHQTMTISLLEDEAKKNLKQLSGSISMKLGHFSQTMANFPLLCLRHPQFFFAVADFRYNMEIDLN